MHLKKIVILFIVIAGFFVFIPGFAKEPAFNTLEGETIKYEDMIKAPESILLVWTTECSICRDEMVRLAGETGLWENLSIYFVDTGEHPATVKRFAESHKFNTPFRKKIVLDRDYFVADKFSVNAVPTYIFFKDKKPVYRSFYLDKKLLDSAFKK